MSTIEYEETIIIAATEHVSLCLHPFEIPTELNPEAIANFFVVENSIIGILSIPSREGDIAQYMGSHPTIVVFEFALPTSSAKTPYDLLIPGNLYWIRLRIHDNLLINIWTRLLLKSEEYPSTGPKGNFMNCAATFIEDEEWALWIKAIDHKSITVVENPTLAITSSEHKSITVVENPVLAITTSEDKSIVTEEAETCIITTSLVVAIEP